MQTAGMLRGPGAIGTFNLVLIATLILAYIGDHAHALPLQVLPNIPGYIPVYIRHGDQPLDEINPALAEAFHEKQTLENTPPEHLGNSGDDLRKNLDNHPSYDDEEDDGGLNAGSERKGTIYLIGVRQSGEDKTSNGKLRTKIALPFEILERQEFDASSGDNEDAEKSKDVWTEEAEEQNSARKPISLSKEAVIKASGRLPVDLKDLERLAAQVEREETRPNDIYDGVVAGDRRAHSVRRPLRKMSIDRETTTKERNERIIDDADDRIIRPIEQPKDFHSGKLRSGDRMLRPARDPKESRPSDESIDFMLQEE